MPATLDHTFEHNKRCQKQLRPHQSADSHETHSTRGIRQVIVHDLCWVQFIQACKPQIITLREGTAWSLRTGSRPGQCQTCWPTQESLPMQLAKILGECSAERLLSWLSGCALNPAGFAGSALPSDFVKNALTHTMSSIRRCQA